MKNLLYSFRYFLSQFSWIWVQFHRNNNDDDNDDDNRDTDTDIDNPPFKVTLPFKYVVNHFFVLYS